ncbi:unnamed protein product [Dracunculus medinensis]|uniref:Transmembrane protein n=1 Tax=Dracunculus medinensis TaxID=318479 RepID=A0A0N4UE79_DRAME|nr:unnamed protein product [Dracunculus medinensis]
MEYRRCKNLTVILILIFSIFLYFLYFLNLYFAKFFSIKEEKRYREMTKSVDPNQIYGRVNFTRGFGEEIRSANRNLVAVFNTLLTVGGAFIFGFYGIQYAYPNLNLNNMVRVTIGLILATIVFFADIYFIITRMDDLGEKPIQNKDILNN